MVPEAMHNFGPITIVAPSTINADIRVYSKVWTTYTISPLDGRVNINGWTEFMENEDHLRMGDTMQFVLFTGISGVFLFTYHIRHMSLE
jgi:hypothetical protein